MKLAIRRTLVDVCKSGNHKTIFGDSCTVESTLDTTDVLTIDA